MITRTVIPTLTLLLCLVARPAFSTRNPPPRSPQAGKAVLFNGKSVFEELQREGVLDLTVTTDMEALEGKRLNEIYQAAALSYEIPGYGSVSREAEVRVRGKYRRRVCDFPPLKVKFSEASLLEGGLNPEFRTLKLVTHCLESEAEGNENVLREYLVYKLYEMVSDKGYRVQLARITYRDSGGSNRAFVRYGFLIEDTDEMAERIGGTECNECYNPSATDLLEKDATVMALFQFMIGNADWKSSMLRNLKMVTISSEEKGVLVPYDFDFSGLVNTSYAKPNPDYGLTRVRDRVYLGFPVQDPVMKWALNYFKFRKDAMLGFVSGFDLLSRKSRQDMTAYLSQFFAYIGDIKINKATGLYEKISEEVLIYSGAAGVRGLEEQG